jgi:hypothetical protein
MHKIHSLFAHTFFFVFLELEGVGGRGEQVGGFDYLATFLVHLLT